jgi:hypothetical protein
MVHNDERCFKIENLVFGAGMLYLVPILGLTGKGCLGGALDTGNNFNRRAKDLYDFKAYKYQTVNRLVER